MAQVLIIDDDPAQLHVREAVLREAGFSVCTSGDAQAALDLLRNPAVTESLGVIVTDHVMPGASGSVFVKELRRASPQVPVIVVSGLAEAEEEYSALNVTFLHKPCQPEELIRQVRAFLERTPDRSR
jgi:DNA-binding response OmpR family regulator